MKPRHITVTRRWPERRLGTRRNSILMTICGVEEPADANTSAHKPDEAERT